MDLYKAPNVAQNRRGVHWRYWIYAALVVINLITLNVAVDHNWTTDHTVQVAATLVVCFVGLMAEWVVLRIREMLDEFRRERN